MPPQRKPFFIGGHVGRGFGSGDAHQCKSDPAGFIFYSLGNFTFASKSTTSDVSAIIRLRLDDKQRTAEIIPLDVLHRRVGFQPQLLKGEKAGTVIEKINELSKSFKTVIQNSEGRYTIPF